VSGETTIAVRGGFKRTAFIALERLNVRYAVSEAVSEYNNRQSTQIPANIVIAVERGFSRSIEFKKTKALFQYASGNMLDAC
jgi:hypothetical protein